MRSYFYMTPGVSALLAGHGLDSADRWLAETPGLPSDAAAFERISLSQDGTHDVWRVVLGNERFYLKRRWNEKPGSLLRMLFFGRRSVSGPLREAKLAGILRDAGFAVMEPVAYGEQRGNFLPVRGFLLTREIHGRAVEILHNEGGDRERADLLFRLGKLTGRLHAAGFFQHVRLKDLIEAETGELFLIDRETTKPWRRKFSLKTSVTNIARALRRTMRDGHRLGIAEAGAFFRGYCPEIRHLAALPPREIRRLVMCAVRSELKG